MAVQHPRRSHPSLWCSSCDPSPTSRSPPGHNHRWYAPPKDPWSSHAQFRQANWICVNEDLAQHLEADLPAARIVSSKEFKLKVNELVHIIKEVLGDHLKERWSSPFIRRWWTKELTQLKKQQNQLSGKAYKLCHVWDHLRVNTSAPVGDPDPYLWVYILSKLKPRSVWVIRYRWPGSAGQVPVKIQVLVI